MRVHRTATRTATVLAVAASLSATHDRGVAALQALRVVIGDGAPATVLRRWATENADNNVTTADPQALAEQIGGQQLDRFCDAPLPRGITRHWKLYL